MKKIITLMMLATSITVNLCAQDKASLSNTDKTFEPASNNITRRFIIDLGKGNSMQLELSSFENIEHLQNIDSLVKVFFHDMEPLKDSLSNELLSKRIDYITDEAGRKKIRIQLFQPKGSSFLVAGNDVASLKVEQDTVYISGMAPGNTQGTILSKTKHLNQYYRIGFFVNQLADLRLYTDGRLNEKMAIVLKSEYAKWAFQKDRNWRLKGGDPSISAKHPRGYAASMGDQLEINAGMHLQNYKNYFVPSFSIKAAVNFSNDRHKNEIGLAWEPQFLFAKNTQGTLVTYRNDFLTLILAHEPREVDSRTVNEPDFSFLQRLSIGYLVRNKGDFYDAHTFRIGMDAVEFRHGKLKLEPLIYFHDFFKGVTPGLRLSVGF